MADLGILWGCRLGTQLHLTTGDPFPHPSGDFSSAPSFLLTFVATSPRLSLRKPVVPPLSKAERPSFMQNLQQACSQLRCLRSSDTSSSLHPISWKPPAVSLPNHWSVCGKYLFSTFPRNRYGRWKSEHSKSVPTSPCVSCYHGTFILLLLVCLF